jgi:hypothetical protein
MRKYRKISTPKDVVFIEVIKNPFWCDNKDRFFNDETNNPLNIGDITWIHKNYTCNDKTELIKTDVCIENNAYYFNFEPSCFKIIHTSVQKIKR